MMEEWMMRGKRRMRREAGNTDKGGGLQESIDYPVATVAMSQVESSGLPTGHVK